MIKNWQYPLIVILLVIGFDTPSKQDSPHKKAPSGTYRLVGNWPQFPEDFELGMPTGIGIDTRGDLYVFHRAGREWKSMPIPDYPPIPENTVLKIDRNSGEVVDSWGDGLFIMPHGLTVDQQNNIWVTDCGLHQVFKFSPEGKLLMTLGEAKVPGDDAGHFNLPTDVAVAPDGTFYVSDGYGNSRVVKFSAEGSYLFDWGSKGNKPGQFLIPHGIDLDKNGNVYVADRENNRIQIFDATGQFLKQWQNSGTDQLYSVTVDEGREHLFGVDYLALNDTLPMGSDIFRFDLETNLQMQFGRTGNYDGPIARYHDIAVDADGSIYLGDIYGNRIQKFEWVQN